MSAPLLTNVPVDARTPAERRAAERASKLLAPLREARDWLTRAEQHRDTLRLDRRRAAGDLVLAEVRGAEAERLAAGEKLEAIEEELTALDLIVERLHLGIEDLSRRATP